MRRAAAVLALVLVPLAGCGHAPPPESARDRNEPTVKRVPVRTKLAVAPDGLSPKTAERLDALAADWRRRGLGPFRVSVDATDAAGARALKAAVRGALVGRGGRPEKLDLRARTDAGSRAVTVSYDRARLVLPDCSMNRAVAPHGNSAHPNLGCATRRNMGVMLADPRDLVRPRGEGGTGNTGAVRAQRVIDLYRQGRDTRAGGMKPVDVETGGN